MAKKTKKSAVKKAVKKIIKKITGKKPAKKPAPKKVVKKPVAKKAAVKKPAAKKVAQKKSAPAKKAVASKVTKSIKPSPAKKPEVKKPLTRKDNITYMNAKPNKKSQPLAKKIELPTNYKPGLKEEYMNNLQLEYFRRKLNDWKKELLSESTETLEHLKTESWNEPDPSDQATIVEQTGLELRTRDRYRKLIAKIDSALNRIEAGEYGYCEVTGDPIGIPRLEARPIATMTIAAQEQHEMEERLNLEG